MRGAQFGERITESKSSSPPGNELQAAVLRSVRLTAGQVKKGGTDWCKKGGARASKRPNDQAVVCAYS